MRYRLSRPIDVRWILIGLASIVTVAACRPSVTPDELQTAFQRDVPARADVRQVEAFLEEREIGYSRGSLPTDSTLRASIRYVKRDLVSSYDILMEFKFDGDGKLKTHRIYWSDTSP